MASQKTLARAGASLINRLFISNPIKQTNNHHHLLIPQISTNPSSHSLLQTLQIDSTPARFDAEILKKLASPQGVDFPCGLPSLRFFIDEGDDALPNEPLLFHTHRTYQPSTIKRKRTHGYLARKATKGGRKVIARRIAKGRARIAV